MFVLKKGKITCHTLKNKKKCAVTLTCSPKANLKTGAPSAVYLEILRHQPLFQTRSLCLGSVVTLGAGSGSLWNCSFKSGCGCFSCVLRRGRKKGTCSATEGPSQIPLGLQGGGERILREGQVDLETTSRPEIERSRD